jgi:hypothetical protein
MLYYVDKSSVIYNRIRNLKDGEKCIGNQLQFTINTIILLENVVQFTPGCVAKRFIFSRKFTCRNFIVKVPPHFKESRMVHLKTT